MSTEQRPPADSHPSLDVLRQQIDSLDGQIVRLLNDRARHVVEIGRLKQQAGTPIYAPDREKLILDRLRELNSGPLPHRCLEAVYRELMSGSFALERPLRIGYLGPPGTFSHGAAVLKFGSSVEYVDLATIMTVFDEVARGHVDYGLVPVENSLHGGVIDTLDAFLQSTARICAEVKVVIRHNLLSKEPWEQVRKIYSKPEVFSQCRKWLSGTAEARETHSTPSTSAAAEIASREPGAAAIAGAIAGELYGLRTLFEDIQDNADNVTRFFVIGREPAGRSGDDMTAIMFKTANKPGALADVLDSFKEAGINLTGIEKRPSRTVNWEYYFFIDAEGHCDDSNMKQGIDDARRHCLQLTVLGSYPKSNEVL